MKGEERIIELLSEMVQKQDQQTQEMIEMKKGIEKLNLQTAENTRAIIKLADKLEEFADHEKRISKLESAVFK